MACPLLEREPRSASLLPPSLWGSPAKNRVPRVVSKILVRTVIKMGERLCGDAMLCRAWCSLACLDTIEDRTPVHSAQSSPVWLDQLLVFEEPPFERRRQPFLATRKLTKTSRISALINRCRTQRVMRHAWLYPSHHSCCAKLHIALQKICSALSLRPHSDAQRALGCLDSQFVDDAALDR